MQWWTWLAAAGIACSAAGSGEAGAEPSEPPPLTGELPALKLLREVPEAASPTQRLEAVDRALAMLAQPTPFRGLVLCTRGSILDRLERYDEARAAFEQCLQLRPDDARPLLALAGAAVERKRPLEAAQLVSRAASLDADAVRRVQPASMHSLFRQLRYAGAYAVLHQLIDTLVSTGWAREYAHAFSPLAAMAIRDRLQEGDRAAAVALLPMILEPRVGVAMLIDRRVATIWPDVERWAGVDLSVQRQAMVNAARGAYEVHSGASETLAYADALDAAGRRVEAIAKLQSFLAAPPPDIDPFFRIQAATKLARYLAEAGRRPEGIAVLRAALSGPDSADRSVANVVPNLAVELLLAKDYAAALALLDARTPAADAVEAPAALGYFVALRACALRGLGRDSAADEALMRARTVYAMNRDAVEIATACAGTADAVATLWIANARNPETRMGALTDFAAARYREKHGIVSTTLAGQALAGLTSRPDVTVVYDELARELPQLYGPAAVGYMEPTR